MRTLVQILQDHDPGFLRAVAELWGIELASDAGPEALSAALRETLDDFALPEPAERALEYLRRSDGRVSWEQLQRQFGPLREMGAGRRDRLKPWREPASALEMLWYRGLIGRAFADSPSGPLEFGFIPSDLLELLPEIAAEADPAPGAPGPTPRRFTAASSQAVDDATTLLASLRRSPQPVNPERLAPFLLQPESHALIRSLAADLPQQPERLKRFLISSRGAALAWLQRAWRDSAAWNDLSQLEQLQVAGDQWPNDPVGGRRAALDLLGRVPQGQWWLLSETVGAIHERWPNFLRGPGGFESWYLQRASDGKFLSGIAHWEAVEGGYLRYLVAGPLHWLGGVDLSEDRQSFRITPAAAALFGGEGDPAVDEPVGVAVVRPDGAIRVARSVDRSLRYQLARFTLWEQADAGGYRYRLSADALQQAERQGLTAAQAASLLEQVTGGKLPPGPARALERWSSHGLEASLLHELVLQVEDPRVLDRLTEQRSTRRYIQARLGPNRAVVRAADWPKLTRAALELGLLIGEPGAGPHPAY